MSTRQTGREHTQRDKGRSPRAKMERQVETHILSSSNPRVKVGERCKLCLMSDGTARVALPDQMGMGASWGYQVEYAEQEQRSQVSAGGDFYEVSFEAWQELEAWRALQDEKGWLAKEDTLS